MNYIVYAIVIEGQVRYIGHTNNIKRRQTQHIRLCFGALKKKDFYDKVRTLHPNINEFKLEPIREFEQRIDAKRFECLLILKDYFNKRRLWQRVPRITDI